MEFQIFEYTPSGEDYCKKIVTDEFIEVFYTYA